MWHSGDEDGLQSQRFGVQIQERYSLGGYNVGATCRSRDRVRRSIGLGIGIGRSTGLGIGLELGVVVSSVLLFLRNNSPPLPKVENHLVTCRRKLAR